MDTYMRSFPDLFKWRDKTVIESRNNGYVATRMGRRMVVTNSTESNSIVNLPVQGTGSDGFKFALLLLDGNLRDLDARIVHILHDEIIVEVNEDIAGQVEGIVKDFMESAFDNFVKIVGMFLYILYSRFTGSYGHPFLGTDFIEQLFNVQRLSCRR